MKRVLICDGTQGENAMRIAAVGTVDVDKGKISMLRAGEIPICESGLEEMDSIFAMQNKAFLAVERDVWLK